MSDFDPRRSRGKRPCPIWVDAFQRDTQHLEADEVGAYFLILIAMWTRPSCDFPNNSTRLARISRVSTRLWNARIKNVIMEFFIVSKGAVISERLRREATYVQRQVTLQHCRKTGENLDNILKSFNWASTTDNSTDKTAEDTTGTSFPTTYIKDRGEESACARQGDENDKPEVPKEKPKPDDDYKTAIEAYNGFAAQHEWVTCQKITDARKGRMKARLKDAGGLDGWGLALEKSTNSEFLMGGTGSGFRLSLDFLLQESSFTKLMEGFYDTRRNNGSNPTPPRSTGRRGVHDALMAGFAQEAVDREGGARQDGFDRPEIEAPSDTEGNSG